MNKTIFKMMGSLTLVMALTACSHDMPEYKPYDVTDAERVAYAEKVLGDIHIDPNQDWSLTKTFKVVVKADAPLKDISKVQILNGNPFLQSATVLAESAIKNGATQEISFRASQADRLLYASCINSQGQVASVAFTAGADSAYFKQAYRPKITRGMAGDAETLDHPKYVTWNRPDFPDLQQEAHLFLPAGQNNRQQVVALNNHSLETDEFGSVITLIYLDGHQDNQNTRIGYRIHPIDDDKDVQTYIIDDNFDPADFYIKDETKKPTNYSWQGVCLGYKLRNGNMSYEIPYDMHIAFFVVRDGQDLSDDLTRCTVYSVNGHVYLSCEDGTNNDFTDKMFYVWGDVINVPEAPADVKPVEPQIWTYAWEDKDFGDYDMNDCVIEVQENATDKNKLDIKLVALGGARKLWLGFENANAKSYKDYQPIFDKELHEVLGVPVGTLVNTGRSKAEPVSITVDKPAGFDFQTCSFVLGAMFKDDQQGVYDNDYYAIHIATKGQDPHGIVIPGKWEWPTETTCIKDAYPKFVDWAKDVTDADAQDWYKHPVKGKVIPQE